MKTKPWDRPVGTIAPGGTPDPSRLGDEVELPTGERLMIVGAGVTTYVLRSLNGRGTALITPKELVELGVDAPSGVR